MLPAFEAYARALSTVRFHAGTLGAATLVLIGTVIMLSIATQAVATGLIFVLGAGSMILIQVAQYGGQLVSGVLITFLSLGYVRILIECARDREPSLGLLFGEGRRLVVGLISNGLGQTLASLLIMLPGLGFGGLLIYLVFSSTLDVGLRILIGVCAGAVLLILTTPLALWSYVSFAFLVDRDQPPLGALASGWRSLNLWGALRYGMTTIVMAGVAAIVIGLSCSVGSLLVLPWLALSFVHVYLDACQRLEGKLELPERKLIDLEPASEAADPEQDPTAAPDDPRPEPSAADQTAIAPSGYDAPPGYGGAAGPPPGYGEGAGVGAPVTEETLGEPEQGEPKQDEPAKAPAVAEADAVLEIEDSPVPSWVHPLTLGLLLPLMAAGGSPVTGGFLGYALARQFGFPEWLGVTAGAGALLLFGVAALTVQVLGLRGLQGAAVDRDGVLTERTTLWGGWRLRWSEIDSFQITSQGVMIYPRGRLGRLFGRLIPARDSEAHHLVERLEANGVYRS